jgi:Cu2+-exporting ATPase
MEMKQRPKHQEGSQCCMLSPALLIACAGQAVTAGAVNQGGRLVVIAERCGNATAVSDIVRSVEAAQARNAPLQRLADQVAGKFAIAVLSLSAATFAFWAVAAPRMLPQVRVRHWPSSSTLLPDHSGPNSQNNPTILCIGTGTEACIHIPAAGTA